MSVNSINNLWMLVSQDNEDAFETIFKMFYVRLFQFAETILKNREEAEDVVEDVFLKLWLNRKTLPAINNLNYYLFVSVKHTAFNSLKKNKRNPFIHIDEVKTDIGSIYMNPEESLISAEGIEDINKAIDALPPKCKMIFKLVKEDGLKYKEVANLLDLSVKTIEAQMSTALSKIGRALQSQNSTSKHLTDYSFSNHYFF